MLAVVGVDRRDGIVAGEARVAESAAPSVASRFAHRAIEPVDRYKGEAVDADQFRHPLDIEARGQELLALGRGDPVKARLVVGGLDIRMWTALRPGPSDHLDDLDRGRAAHDRVVDEDDPLAVEIGPARVML